MYLAVSDVVRLYLLGTSFQMLVIFDLRFVAGTGNLYFSHQIKVLQHCSTSTRATSRTIRTSNPKYNSTRNQR
jgi:hypothetical protein